MCELMKTKIKTRKHSCGGKTTEKVATQEEQLKENIKTWKYSTKEQMK